jgi:quinoprotein glucose dehydrogenase
MTAYDLNSGLIKWQTPIGDTPQAGTHDGLWGNMVTKSGVVITGGGLMFFAGGNDSKLYAIDKDNGRVLFSKDLPNGSYGVPAVYEVNGREYLLVPAAGAFRMGLGVKPGAAQPPMEGAQYVAFTLPAAVK